MSRKENVQKSPSIARYRHLSQESTLRDIVTLHRQKDSELTFLREPSERSSGASSMPFLSRLNAPRESAQHYPRVGSKRGLSYGGKNRQISQPRTTHTQQLYEFGIFQTFETLQTVETLPNSSNSFL